MNWLLIVLWVLYCIALGEVDNGSVIHTGEATFYGEKAFGHCGFPVDEQPLFHGAMNHEDYDLSSSCGAWIRVKGPNGEIEAYIDDECPECKSGDIDLGPNAFAAIADMSAGRVPISWSYIPTPDINGPVRYFIKDGSSEFHIEIQVRNYRYAIVKLETQQFNKDWVTADRTPYNFFVIADNGRAIIGPYNLRITDIFGTQLTDSLNDIIPLSIIDGKSNFTLQNKILVVNSQLKRDFSTDRKITVQNSAGFIHVPRSDAEYELYEITGKKLGISKSGRDCRIKIENSSKTIVLIVSKRPFLR